MFGYPRTVQRHSKRSIRQRELETNLRRGEAELDITRQMNNCSSGCGKRRGALGYARTFAPFVMATPLSPRLCSIDEAAEILDSRIILGYRGCRSVSRPHTGPRLLARYSQSINYAPLGVMYCILTFVYP